MIKFKYSSPPYAIRRITILVVSFKCKTDAYRHKVIQKKLEITVTFSDGAIKWFIVGSWNTSEWQEDKAGT